MTTDYGNRIAIINQFYLLASQLFFPPNQKKKKF